MLNTSRTSCWDGNQNRTTDIPDFDDDDIIDQGNFYFTILSNQVLATSTHRQINHELSKIIAFRH